MPPSNPVRCSSWMGAGSAVESALEDWKSMRVQLSSSIHSYISACTALGMICAREHQTHARQAVEQTLAFLDTKLEPLAAEEKALCAARFSLSVLRNKSETLAPINLLPPEILTRIFDLSIPSCRRHRNAFPYNFANTCTYWRHLALNAPDFWTHVDFGPSIPGALSKLMLERAKDSPLHVHAYEFEVPDWDPEYIINYHEFNVTIAIQPHIHRVRTLELETHNLNGNFTSVIVNFWVSRGDPNLARSLSIYQTSGGEFLLDGPDDPYDFDKDQLYSSEQAIEVLRSLRTLHLRSVIFSWDSSAYHGLVDLRLNLKNHNIVATISISELVNIFMASPKLAILKLRGLRIAPTDNSSPTVPVSLSCLRVLSLANMGADNLQLLLSCIALPTSSAELSVGLPVYDQVQNELRRLLCHSPITTLYCRNGLGSFRVLLPILESIDTLHSLILDGFDFADAIPSIEEHTRFSQPPTDYRLASLTVMGCCPSFDGINGLITRLGVRELRMEKQDEYESGSDDDMQDQPPDGENWQDLGAALRSAHPDLQYVISNKYSTGELYRHILPSHWP